MARTLVNAHQLAAFSGSTATVAKFAEGVYTGGMSMESGSVSSVGTLSFYDGGNIGYAGSKIQLYNNTNIDGTLTIDGSLTVDAVTLTSTELAYLDGLTLGTAAASKVMTLDASSDVTGARNITLSGELDAATGDFSGDIDVDGTANLDDVNVSGSVQIDGATTFGVDDTGVDVKMFGATSGKYMLWDQSGDELVLAGNGTKLSFFDAAGGESISADNAGELSFVAGAELDFTAPTIEMNTDTLNIESANAADPLVTIKNTTSGSDGSRLRFVKDKGAAGADNDIAGQIEFYADDDNQDQVMFAKIVASVADATNGEEGGKLELFVAEHDGTATAGLSLSDGNANGEIDVTIGAGAASIVTIPGNLVVTGTTTTVDVEVVNTANGVIFEGATDDGNETTLKAVDPTADQTVQIANASGFLIPFAAVSTTTISSTPEELNLLDGVTGLVQADFTKLAALDATAAELNLLDGGTSVGSSITVVDGDGIFVNDGGTTKLIPASDIQTYCATSLSSSGEIYSSTELRTSGDLNVSGSLVMGDSSARVSHFLSQITASSGISVFGAEGADGVLVLAADEADDAADRWQLVAQQAAAQFQLRHGGGTVPISATATGDVTILGDLTITGDDLIMNTNTSGHMLVADGTSYNPVAISGDVTMANNGAVTIAATAVEGSMLNTDVISAQTALASGLAATDELMVSDAGTLKRMDISVLSAFQAGPGISNVSGELGVDYVIDTVIGSNGHNYASATGVYTLSETALTGSEMVYLNGQMLMPGANLSGGDYSTATGSVELHPDLKLDADDVLRVYYLK
jgi:hypothetical protein